MTLVVTTVRGNCAHCDTTTDAFDETYMTPTEDVYVFNYQPLTPLTSVVSMFCLRDVVVLRTS
jgi:hypothetical protein